MSKTFDSSFVDGFIEAMIFTETDNSVDKSDWGIDESYDGSIPCDSVASDIHPDTLAAIIADCEKFQEDNESLLTQAYDNGGYTPTDAGRDYWFTRNGHGVGFWDRPMLEPKCEQWEALKRPIDTWSPEDSILHNKLKSESIGEKLSAACRYQEVNAYFDGTYIFADGL